MIDVIRETALYNIQHIRVWSIQEIHVFRETIKQPVKVEFINTHAERKILPIYSAQNSHVISKQTLK